MQVKGFSHEAVLCYTQGPLQLPCTHNSREGAFFFSTKILLSFLFLNESICCGYSLEAPRQGASNEYPQQIFCGGIRKIFTKGRRGL